MINRKPITETAVGMTYFLCVTATVAAAPFQVLRVAADGPSGGHPITWSGSPGTAFNSLFGSMLPPHPKHMVGFVAQRRYDTYVGMDPIGPSIRASDSSAADGYASLSALEIDPGTSLSSPNQIIGEWWSEVPVSSGTGPRMFLLSLSLRPGSSAPTTLGLQVTIIDSATPNTGAAGLVRFGLENASNNGGAWSQDYYLDTESSAIAALNTPFNGGVHYGVYLRAAGPHVPPGNFITQTRYVPTDTDARTDIPFIPRWLPAPLAVSYSVVVSQSPDLGQPILSTTIPHVFDDEVRATLDISSLQPDGEYYWGVEAVNAAGITALTPSSVYFRTAPRCTADFVPNHQVNVEDLTVLLGNFGQSVTPNVQGDANGDGLVNVNDLVILLGGFGRPCGP